MLQPSPPITPHNHARELKKQDAKLKKMLHKLRTKKNDLDYEGECLTDVLSAMMAYANLHFKAENEIMKKLDYPGYQRHKKQHQQFLEIITQSFMDIMEKSADPTQRVIELLTFWVDNHFAIEDKQLDHFIKQAKYLS